MIDKSATSDMVLKSKIKIRTLACVEEELICHTAQPETSDGEEPSVDSPEDSNRREKIWKKNPLEEICEALELFRCNKTQKGALQQCCSTGIV